MLIFRPSTSDNGNMISDYEEAEIQGRKEKDCTKYNKECTISFIDLVSWIGHAV